MTAAEIKKYQFHYVETAFKHSRGKLPAEAILNADHQIVDAANLDCAFFLREIAYQLAVFNEGMARLCSETKPGVPDEQIHIKVQNDATK